MKLAPEFETIPCEILPDKKQQAEKYWEEFTSSSVFEIPVKLQKFFSAVFQLSPYLRTCGFKEAEFIRLLLEDGFEKTAASLLQKTLESGKVCSSEAEIMSTLRVNKRRIALLCGLADLGSWWTGNRVTALLSDFAKASLSATLDFILLQQHASEKLILTNPQSPQNDCGLIVFGMGKLGAGELNYSSDIDLILFFEQQSGIKLNTDDPITLLSRMAKQLIKIMQERTSDGYVFRMDLRLRPDPSSTPLVIPVEAALIYYEGQGQNWERAAMIKARAVAGDLKCGENFLKELSPFIWRKYLDFAAINDIHSIKRQIHAHKGHAEIRVLGHNIKLGRGGIREIEFFVQTQQLIAGGRNLALRTNETIAALHELAELGWIKTKAAQELAQAYWFLRNLEHRLQMVSDEQTHTLPENEKEFAVISHMSGMPDVKAFSTKIRKTLECVEQHYAELFESSENLASSEGNLVFTGDEDDPETLKTLTKIGYTNPSEVMKLIKRWHVAKMPALRTTKAREMLTELAPSLLASFGETEQPDETLFVFDKFLAGLPAGIQLFSILQNNPKLANLLLNILTSAPRLSHQISQKPHVFDAMLDPDFASHAMDSDGLLTRLTDLLDRTTAYEAKLDQARVFFHEASFLYGCQYFSGIASLEQTRTAFSMLGDVMVTAMFDCVRAEFEKRHGKVPGAQVCILGMGRLGSRELTATSDLDLIFLYNFDENNDASDGEKELPASLYFIRLMQRFISAMSSPTAEGIIYDLDFRLRPSGNAGPLATHVDGFLKYQKQEAWIWEAQSLTRARPIVGDSQLIERLVSEIPEILKATSQKDTLKKEIREMRKRIEVEKGRADIWSVKTAKGGLLDIEFIAQYLVIKGAASNAICTANVISTADREFLSDDSREKLATAFHLYEKILHLQRICFGENADIEKAPTGFIQQLCRIFDLPDLKTCRAALSSTQNQTRELFKQIMAD